MKTSYALGLSILLILPAVSQAAKPPKSCEQELSSTAVAPYASRSVSKPFPQFKRIPKKNLVLNSPVEYRGPGFWRFTDEDFVNPYQALMGARELTYANVDGSKITLEGPRPYSIKISADARYGFRIDRSLHQPTSIFNIPEKVRSGGNVDLDLVQTHEVLDGTLIASLRDGSIGILNKGYKDWKRDTLTKISSQLPDLHIFRFANGRSSTTRLNGWNEIKEKIRQGSEQGSFVLNINGLKTGLTPDGRYFLAHLTFVMSAKALIGYILGAPFREVDRVEQDLMVVWDLETNEIVQSIKSSDLDSATDEERTSADLLTDRGSGGRKCTSRLMDDGTLVVVRTSLANSRPMEDSVDRMADLNLKVVVLKPNSDKIRRYSTLVGTVVLRKEKFLGDISYKGGVFEVRISRDGGTVWLNTTDDEPGKHREVRIPQEI
ncbi:MAG: hypothetical protein KF799_09470 [Bdellovibrionales bacterium]|nr:hypothetical protein [Bdellovibrionales bacterium]